MRVRNMILAAAVLLCLRLPAEAEPLVALTFDDGPSGKFTRQLLEGLAQRQVRATFFLCGYRLEQYGPLAEEIAGSGHEIGIHGYSHRSMGKMTAAEVGEEIRKTRLLLPEGCDPVFFRPPGGIITEAVKLASREEGLALLSWDVDPKDWAEKDCTRVLTRVVSKTRDGDVILLHDMSASSVAAALAIVDELKARGYRFVTVSELAAIRTGNVQPGVAYSAFPPPEPAGTP